MRASEPDCPLSPDYLDDQRRVLGPARYAQEYEVSFISSESLAFDYVDLSRAFGGAAPPDGMPTGRDADRVVHSDHPFRVGG